MKPRDRFVCAAGVLGLLLASVPSPAQSPPSKVIVADVIVEGNHRVPTEKILSIMKTRPSEEYDQERVNDDIRRVYHTHEFANIQVQRRPGSDGRVIVYFLLAEFPGTVEEIVYNGAKHVKLGYLEELTGLHKGMPLNPVTNQLARAAILKHYHDKGRMFAGVDLVEGDKTGDTRVVFNITEGPVVKVSGIEFQGCSFASPARLRAQLDELRAQFDESPAFQSLVHGDYNPNSRTILCAEYITAKVEDYYRSFGFLDVRVAREVQWDENQRSAKLIFHIEEGPRSRVGTAVSPAHTETIKWSEGEHGEVEIHYEIQERPPARIGAIVIPSKDPVTAGSLQAKP